MVIRATRGTKGKKSSTCGVNHSASTNSEIIRRQTQCTDVEHQNIVL